MKRYGNPDVIGAGANHGTHVAGIIAGVPSAQGAMGIAQAARIMAIRTVPDGDERDKDIALAIRFAVDHGAQVINMSFGKAHSPYKNLVDDAVKYADSKGVLMVHAAGNEGEMTGEHPSFPTPYYLDGGRARNWIEVGASSWKGTDSLAALLERQGHDARTAYGGVEAVQVAREYRPDIVLLDLGLPQLSGYEVGRQIRALGGGDPPLMIAITGWGHDENRERTRALGFTHHLVKPVDPAVLMQLLAPAEPAKN